MLKNRRPKIDHSGLVRLPFPAEIAIETHSYCNFRCVVCPYLTMKRPKGNMAPELYKKIIDEVAQESPETRLWLAIMGEPLMDKNIVTYMQYAKKCGARRVHLNTNGTYLEGRLAQDILDADVESVYVAIDAFSAETYAIVRPGGDFSRVIKNVENFAKMRVQSARRRPEIVVQFIIMKENESEVEEFKNYWLERGIVVKIRLRQGWGHDNISTPDLDKVNIERFPCPWLLRTMNIDWNGHVAQCDGDYEERYSAGDINHQKIKEVWSGELAQRRERHWAGDHQHPLCRDCRDWAAGRAEFFYPNQESKERAPRWSLGEKGK